MRERILLLLLPLLLPVSFGCKGPRKFADPLVKDAGAGPDATHEIRDGAALGRDAGEANDAGNAQDTLSLDIPSAPDEPASTQTRDGPLPDSSREALSTEPGAVLWYVNTRASSEGLSLNFSGNIALGGRSYDVDQDIVLAIFSQDGALTLRRNYGNPQSRGEVTDLKLATNGSLVITGNFRGTKDFGGQVRTSIGGDDVFVASYSAGLELESVIAFGSTENDLGQRLLIDEPSGDWIVTGNLGRDVALGGQTIEGFGTYLFRINSLGELRWNRRGGSQGISKQPNSSVFVVGGNGDLISLHFVEDGTTRWTRTLEAGVNPRALAIDRLGRILVAGSFTDTLTVRGQAVRRQGTDPSDGYDIFLMAMTADGEQILWADVVAGSQGTDWASAVCVDQTGNIYVGGYYEGSVSAVLGEAKGPRRPLVAKYRADGTRMWVKILDSHTTVQNLICDSSGGLVVGLDGGLVKLVP